MAKIVLNSNHDINGVEYTDGDCIWCDANDVKYIYKEVKASENSARLTVCMYDGFKYYYNYKEISQEEIEKEFKRLIDYVSSHQDGETKVSKIGVSLD